MLSPEDRRLFLDALKPPEGYQFDRGIGTTFTLDLLTLLVAPLSMALFDCSSVEDALKDPLILLESLQKNANRLSIFCNSGYISVPRNANYLFSYLEDMIVEVQAPKGGYFHPKVWLLRYVRDGKLPRYRLLNLSRNLTFDRSWDLMVQLDGEVADRKVGYSQNRPLSDFISILPSLAVQTPSRRIQEDIQLISEEIRKAVFERPENFYDHVAFFPSGIKGYLSYRFNQPVWRMMVVSPFLTRPFLNQITREGSDHILISKLDSIDGLSLQLRNRFKQIYVLDDQADLESDGESIAPNDHESQESSTIEKKTELSGLHAKIFVMEDRREATWVVGSANATDAAFRGRNVEFMIEMVGRKRDVGIDKILGDEDDDFSLRALLRDYPATRETPTQDEDQVVVEQMLEQIRDWIVSEKMEISVEPSSEDVFNIVIHKTTGAIPPDGSYKVHCWPISIPHDQMCFVDIKRHPYVASFKNLDILSLTPFIAYQIEAREGNARAATQFVVRLPISGLPEMRNDYIFGAIISNRIEFLRYLRLLLAGEYDVNLSEFASGFNKGLIGKEGSWEDLDLPLLEDMVRALSRSPEGKIDRIGEIVNRLRRTPDGKKVIPEEFDWLWDAITIARGQLK